MEQLLVIQQGLNVPKNQRNNFGNYNFRSLEDILEAVKPILESEKCVLIISDSIENIGTKNYVKATAVLLTNEGKEIASNTAYAREAETQKGMNDSQLTGSTSSYARKYALNGLFAIDDTKDSDATNTHGKGDTKQAPQSKKKARNYTEEASKIGTLSELKKWFLGLPSEEQIKSEGVKNNRKEEIQNSQGTETTQFEKLITDAKNKSDLISISNMIEEDRKTITNYSEIAELFNKKCDTLGFDDLSLVPF